MRLAKHITIVACLIIAGGLMAYAGDWTYDATTGSITVNLYEGNYTDIYVESASVDGSATKTIQLLMAGNATNVTASFTDNTGGDNDAINNVTDAHNRIDDVNVTDYLTDVNATVDAMTHYDCPAGNFTYGILDNGTLLCRNDTGGAGTSYTDAEAVAAGIAHYVNRTDWTTHDDYPATCGAGEYVRAIGDSLTCVADQTTGAGIPTEEGVYGEISNSSDAGITVDIIAVDVYVTVQDMACGELSNVTCTPDNQSLGIDVAGVYRITWSMSFSGGNSQEYEIAPFKNDATELEHCEMNRKLGSGGDVGAAGGSCLETLAQGDNISLKMKDVTAAVADDATYNNVNLNVQRLIVGYNDSGLEARVDDNNVTAALADMNVSIGELIYNTTNNGWRIDDVNVTEALADMNTSISDVYAGVTDMNTTMWSLIYNTTNNWGLIAVVNASVSDLYAAMVDMNVTLNNHDALIPDLNVTDALADVNVTEALADMNTSIADVYAGVTDMNTTQGQLIYNTTNNGWRIDDVNVTEALADMNTSFVLKAGDTMTGNLSMGDLNISDVDCIYFTSGGSICAGS